VITTSLLGLLNDAIDVIWVLYSHATLFSSGIRVLGLLSVLLLFLLEVSETFNVHF